MRLIARPGQRASKIAWSAISKICSRRPPTKNVDLRLALSYREAMHRTCIECHKTEAVKQNKPHLADCGTCHVSAPFGRRSKPVWTVPQITLERNIEMPAYECECKGCGHRFERRQQMSDEPADPLAGGR